MTVAELLEKPESWCQGAYSRDKHEVPNSDYTDYNSCKWCVQGAVWKVTFGKSRTDLYKSVFDCRKEMINKLCNVLGLKNNGGQGSNELITWNDTYGRTHTEVLEAVKKAEI